MADTLTEQQIADYKDTFSLYDKRQDGTVTKEDLNRIIRALGKTPTDEDIERMIKEAEPADENRIDFPEFLTIMTKTCLEIRDEEEIIEAFKAFDKVGNGFISTAELRKIMTTLGEKMSDELVDEMISEADCDGEGQIDYKDFARTLFRD